MGAGRVTEIKGRHVVVYFPLTDITLQFGAATEALAPLTLNVGGRARHEPSGEMVVIEEVGSDSALLTDGRRVPVAELWPLLEELAPVERLVRGKVDAFEDFANRLDAIRLLRLRQADGLGSFLGGRIQLFPHQLYCAERACQSDPVRWLLADEVGLGKTVEACLILNRLLHTGRAERTLIVAPETLTLQWLGELWRKHHQIFVLLDAKRLADVARDHGEGFNPFEVHRRSIVSLELLTERRALAEKAAEAGIDLLVVDEAHHLKRPKGHPGNEAYRAVAPIAALGRHALLLTATPLEDDAHGFFRLLQLLRPEEFPQEESFEERLSRREPLPPCTSSTRRADIGGLPPRQAEAVALAAAEWESRERLIEHLRRQPAENPLERRRKAERIQRALSSSAALRTVLDRADFEGEELSRIAERDDPRVRWLAAESRRWTGPEEKTLVFVAHRETLEPLKVEMERQGRRVGLFHEELSAERRDIEVAQFRLPEGPSILLSTEAGGEGRNFQFCRRLVLFDLPWNPGVVEQRIGRLDRIGRTIPTEILYFRPPGGLGRTVAELYEEIGLFREPLGGLERELRHAAQALEEVALGEGGHGGPPLHPSGAGGESEGNAGGLHDTESGASDAGLVGAPPRGRPSWVGPQADGLLQVLREAREAQSRVQRAAYHELHRDPYRPELAAGILARVPPDLDRLNEDLVVRAASRFGFEVEEQSAPRTWRIEIGYEALVESLPGVPAGSSYFGTFDRAEAVDNETRDFFSSGHPLVEGVLAELEDGPRGRVSLFQVSGPEEAFGLLVLQKEGVEWQLRAVDAKGTPRPDLARRFLDHPFTSEPFDAKKWTGQAAWAKTIRRLAATLPAGRIEAVAAFRIRKGV